MYLLCVPSCHVVIEIPRTGCNLLPTALISPGVLLCGQEDVGELAGNTLLHAAIEFATAVEVTAGKLCGGLKPAIDFIVMKAGEIKACAWNIGLGMPKGGIARVCTQILPADDDKVKLLAQQNCAHRIKAAHDKLNL